MYDVISSHRPVATYFSSFVFVLVQAVFFWFVVKYFTVCQNIYCLRCVFAISWNFSFPFIVKTVAVILCFFYAKTFFQKAIFIFPFIFVVHFYSWLCHYCVGNNFIDKRRLAPVTFTSLRPFFVHLVFLKKKIDKNYSTCQNFERPLIQQTTIYY